MFLSVGLLMACEAPEEVPPRPVSAASPFAYPIAQWDERVEGEVVLMVQVGADGHADTAYVHASSGVPALDSAALADVDALLFAPARRDGDRVDTWIRLPVRYRMDGGPEPTDAQAPENAPPDPAGLEAGQ